MLRIPDFFITATDTGVGKTVVSLLLMRHLMQKGFSPFYLKPFQTGCKDAFDTDSDARFVYNHIDSLDESSLAESVLYCYEEPKAPWIAAQNEGLSTSYEQVIHRISTTQKQHSPVIIEGAGGLMVPITQSNYIIDLVSNLQAVPILVARAGLGTINHTLLSLEALFHRNSDIKHVILMNTHNTIEKQMIAENCEAISARFPQISCSVINHIDNFSAIPPDCEQIIDAIADFYSV